MQEIKKIGEEEFGEMSLDDIGYFNDDLRNFLHTEHIEKVSQLISFASINDNIYIRRKIRKVIPLIKYRYLGELPHEKEYLDRKIDLNETKDEIENEMVRERNYNWDTKNYSFILQDGYGIHFSFFFPNIDESLSEYLAREFVEFVRNNETKYPDGTAPIIDFLNYISYNYMTTHIDDYPVLDLIVRTYISMYEGNNIIEDREDIRNKRISDLERLREKRKDELKEYLHFEKEPDSEYNKYLQFYFQKVLDNNKPIKDVFSIAEYIENDLLDYRKIEYLFKTFGIDKDKKMFNSIMENVVTNINKIKNKKIRTQKLCYADELKKLLEFKFENITDKKEIKDILIKEKENGRYHWSQRKRYLSNFYEFIVPDELKNNLKFIKDLLDVAPDFIAFLYKYVDEKDKMGILDEYYTFVYNYGRGNLNEEESEYVINKSLENGGVFLQSHQNRYTNQKQIINAFKNSDLVRKIKEKNGDKLKKYAEKNGLDPNDDAALLRIFVGTSLLKTVYYDGDYDFDDVYMIDCIINLSELNGFKCTKTKERIEGYKAEVEKREKDICNYLSVNKNNDEKIDELLKELNVNKDNFFQYIKERKYIYKKQKESVLLILAKHFNTGYISIYDIIDLMQEMSDRELTIDEILDERNISKKLFHKIYDEFEVTNPEMYEFIKQNLYNNSLRGFKKLLKLYYKIKSSNVNSYEQFLEVFKSTPEEILILFKKTPMYPELYDMISTWYKLDSEETQVIEQTESKSTASKK